MIIHFSDTHHYKFEQENHIKLHTGTRRNNLHILFSKYNYVTIILNRWHILNVIWSY